MGTAFLWQMLSFMQKIDTKEIMESFRVLMIAVLLTLSACYNDIENNEICNSDDPLEDIVWLSEIRNLFDQDMGPQRQRITQYKYYGNDVFLIENCFQCADALSIVYDCKANIVCEFGGIDGRNTCPNFDQNKTNEKILYDN